MTPRIPRGRSVPSPHAALNTSLSHALLLVALDLRTRHSPGDLLIGRYTSTPPSHVNQTPLTTDTGVGHAAHDAALDATLDKRIA